MVRPTPFMEVMTPRVENGEIVLKMPLPEDVAVKMISIKDIGRIAAALLLDIAEAPGGAIELVADELTGPQIAAAFNYRWWPSRASIVAKAVMKGVIPVERTPLPSSGDIRADVRSWLGPLAESGITNRDLILALAAAAATSDLANDLDGIS